MGLLCFWAQREARVHNYRAARQLLQVQSSIGVHTRTHTHTHMRKHQHGYKHTQTQVEGAGKGVRDVS